MTPRHSRSDSRGTAAAPAGAGLPAAGTFAASGLWMLPVLLATRVALWLMQPYAAEDAYITFRYAGELAAGHGLVYNAGERVMGFTSLPWTLWTAAGMALRLDPVGWTRSTSLLADLATLLLGARMLQRAAGAASAWTFAAFFAAWPLFAASSMSGLESSAFVAVVLAGAAAIEARSPAAGPLLGLVAVFRPEGLVAAAVLALGARARDRAIALGMIAVAIAALTAWFGAAIPQSVLAKAGMYGTPGPWAGRHWWEWVLPFPLGRYPESVDGIQLLPVAAVLAASLACGLVALWKQRSSAAARAAAAGLAVWAGYSAVGAAYFWWYLVLPMAAIGIAVAAGFPRIARGAWLPVAAGSLLLGTWTVAPSLYVGRAQSESRLFAGVAEFLFDHARPGESVFLEPIGMIGFRCPLRVIDEVGLVSPAVSKRRLSGAGWYADVVGRERPDWLVVRREVIASGVAFAGAGAPFRDPKERDTMLAGYQEIPASDYGGRELAIYRRRP